MKYLWITPLLLLFLGGCGPKMGKDIVIEPEGTVRLENTKTELVLGMLSVLGMNVEKEPLRIGTDVKVINRWHSDLTLKSLKYHVSEGNVNLAEGKAAMKEPFRVSSNMQRSLPLMIALDPKVLTADRILATIQGKRKIVIEGEAVIEVWGMEHTYPFSKDATPMIQKALRH